MALNFSHRPIFPSRMSEDTLVSPIRLANGRIVNEGVAENTNVSRGGDDYGMCRSGDGSCRQDSDVFDFLPADPFGMDISSTFTAITGWLEDLEMNNVGYMGNLGGGVDGGDYRVFAGLNLNLFWNNAMAMKFQPFPAFGRDSNFIRGDCRYDVSPDIAGVRNQSGDIGLHPSVGISGCSDLGKAENASFVGGFASGSAYEGSSVAFGPKIASGHVGIRSVGDSVGRVKEDEAIDVALALNNNSPDYCCEKKGNSGNETTDYFKDSAGGCSAGNDGAPHYALYLALGYLGLRDLLSVDRVCKSLHSAVRNENSLWRSIHVDQPLNEKITDEVLLQLNDRAQGRLECLSLVECPRITDDGIRRVLESNPKLGMLSVPGCTRLSIRGLLDSLRTLKVIGTLQLKHVRIGGIYGMTEEQFDELKFLLGMESQKLPGDHKPHFYQRGKLYLPCEDNRVIDIEMCPRCQKARLVYDCPDEACMVKEAAGQVCRACTLCIARCIQCGRCINDTEYEETFCLELLCSNCSSEQTMKNQESAGRSVTPSEPVTALDEEPQGDGIVCRG